MEEDNKFKITKSQIFGGKSILADKSNCTFYWMKKEGDYIYFSRDEHLFKDSNDNILECDDKIKEAIDMLTELMMIQK